MLADGAAVSCPARYLINFLLDATVGMLLIYVGVRAVSVLVEWQQWESLRFGEYGNVARTLAGLWRGLPGGLCSLPQSALRASGLKVQELVAVSSVWWWGWFWGLNTVPLPVSECHTSEVWRCALHCPSMAGARRP